MNLKLWLGAIVVTLMASVGALLFTGLPEEPLDQGRPLSAWLLDLEDQRPGAGSDRAEAAVRHLGRKALPGLRRRLRVDSPLTIRLNALLARQSLVQFRFALADQDRYRRALLACSVLGREAEPLVLDIIHLLNHDRTGIVGRGYLGAALDRIGPSAMAALLPSLASPKEVVRIEAIRSLGNGAALNGGYPVGLGDTVARALAPLTGDPSPGVRSLACRALGQVRCGAARAVPALVARLADTDRRVRWHACLALGEFGAAAITAMPALLVALQDPAAEVRGSAAVAMVEVQQAHVVALADVLPVLIANLEGGGGAESGARLGVGQLRFYTAGAVGLLGTRGRAAVPALLRVIENGDTATREVALNSLRKILIPPAGGSR